jgi:hypothetical protein
VTVRAFLLSLVALCLAGCAEGPPRAEPTTTPSATSTPSATATPGPTLEEYVADPDGILSDARVRRTDHGFLVVADWVVERPGRRAKRVLATSDDGFRTATYERYTTKAFYAQIPFEVHDEPGPDPQGQLAGPATSLRQGTLGYVLGGDGATLLPFDRTARSTDDGRTWKTFEVPQVDGEQGYVTGQVVLADGRLLVCLNNWSSDRANRPSRIHHGLWVSAGDDWATFTPYEPPFLPTIDASAQKWPGYSSLEATMSPSGPVIWMSTAEGLLYVSTDDATTFTQIHAR